MFFKNIQQKITTKFVSMLCFYFHWKVFTAKLIQKYVHMLQSSYIVCSLVNHNIEDHIVMQMHLTAMRAVTGY